MAKPMDVVKNEPALISGLVSAVIALAISFGASMSDEQVGSIMAVVTIVMAIVVRMAVVPTNKIPDTPPVETGPVMPPPGPPAEPVPPPVVEESPRVVEEPPPGPPNPPPTPPGV